MKTCEECGCREYNGACVNCHEEIYIEEQCDDFECPPLIAQKASEQREEIKRKEEIMQSI